MKKLFIKIIGLLLLALALVGLYWHFNDGVSHGDICACVKEESVLTREQVDNRANQLETKLDRIEAKLDLIIKLANQPPLDGMRRVE